MYGLASERGRRLHLARNDGSFCAAVDGDEPRGRIARVFLRVARPGVGRQRLDLDAQARRVEADRQAEKGLG